MKANRFLYILAVAALLTAAMVSCKKSKEVTGVELNKTELTLVVDDAETLIATVLPEDAENKVVNWNSSDNNVAEVNNNGTITAKLAGTVLITVTTADGNKTANCTVTVIENKPPIEEPEMVFVEGGTFWYGCTDDECDSLDMLYRTYPPVQKTVNSFYMAKYTVTQKLWKDVMGELFPQLNYGIGDNYPIHIDRIYVREFIRKLNSITGKDYRLPSSEEWEYAAKGGCKSKGYKFSGSNNIEEVAWYNKNSNNSTHPVGEKLPNELGIYDMSGNVWEWMDNERHAPQKSQLYELRGGSYNVPAAWRSGGFHLTSCGVQTFKFALPFPRGYCRHYAKPHVVRSLFFHFIYLSNNHSNTFL